LILRSVGILFTVFLSVYVSFVGRPTLAPNSPTVRTRYALTFFPSIVRFASLISILPMFYFIKFVKVSADPKIHVITG